MLEKQPAYTRRVFLQQGMTLASLVATAPTFLQRSAMGMLQPANLSSVPGVPDDHVIVVVQLSGGNDGLNTVIPFGNDEYYRKRPQIGVPQPGRPRNGQQAGLRIADGFALHPSFSGMKDLFDEGVASIVQGVGYPNPNRSHFTSMDIWHTANTDAQGSGWIGRYYDNCCGGSPGAQSAISIGRETPLSLVGKTHRPVNFESAELFKWLGGEGNDALKAGYDEVTSKPDMTNVDPDSQLGFLLRTTLDARVSSERIRAAVSKSPLVRYPGGQLSRQLQIVGAMVRDNLPSRVYYVSQGGYDTHANQVGSHARLLNQLGSSLKAFYQDLKKQGNSGRVLTMVFSEFGRRVAQNASGGTDHGTAAPMYFIGDMVRPGLLGNHPSLSDLDGGDLKYNVDFREVYAGVLEGWLKAPSAKILGRRYEQARIIRT